MLTGQHCNASMVRLALQDLLHCAQSESEIPYPPVASSTALNSTSCIHLNVHGNVESPRLNLLKV